MESNICTCVCALWKAKVECPANEVGNDFKVTKSIPKFSQKFWTLTKNIFQKLDKYHSSDWVTTYLNDLARILFRFCVSKLWNQIFVST